MSFVLKWENLKQDALKFSYPKYFKPWGKSPKIGCFLTSTVTMKELREDKLLGINQHAVGLLDLSGTWMQCDLFEIIFVEFKNVTLRWETMHWSCKECVKNTTAAVCPNLDIYSLQRQVNRNIWLLGLWIQSLVYASRSSNHFGQAAKLKVSTKQSWSSILSTPMTSW